MLDQFPSLLHARLRINWVFYFSIKHYREFISRDAEGSGVPEMKGVLAGVHLHKFMSINALVGKWVGIVCALSGGLSMGRQGAFVHMTCVVSH